jgi:hypothetical protein
MSQPWLVVGIDSRLRDDLHMRLVMERSDNERRVLNAGGAEDGTIACDLGGRA